MPKDIKTKKALSAKTQIDKDAKIIKIKSEEENTRQYYCSCCGKPYDKQKGNFPYTVSPLFKGNNNYSTICKNCVPQIYTQFVDFFSGNEEKAIERLCQLNDWYFGENPLNSSKKISADRLRINGYVSKLNISPNTGKTYSETLIESSNVDINSIEKLEELRAQGKTTISNASLERWGSFNESDIKSLEDHYKLLKKQNPNCDSNQEIFVKDLCYIKLQQMNAMKINKIDDFDKLTKLYRDTFKQAGLKTVQETDSSSDETLGVTLAVISQYTPEEYYKDKKLYKDFDGLGDYITRFITRPIKNLQFGSKDRDKEYCVKDSEEEYDE